MIQVEKRELRNSQLGMINLNGFKKRAHIIGDIVCDTFLFSGFTDELQNSDNSIEDNMTSVIFGGKAPKPFRSGSEQGRLWALDFKHHTSL